MGRKGPAGFPLFLILVVLLSQTCRQTSVPVDPASRFSSTGEKAGRDLGIYSDSSRVGDMSVAVRIGQWDGSIAATELKQNILFRISFRGDRFTLKSEQTAWVDGDLNLLGSSEIMDFGAGEWETRAVLAGEGRYEVIRSTLGGESREIVTIPEGVIASEALPLFLHRYKGEKGKRVESTIFNVGLGQEIPFSFTAEGTTEEGRFFTITYWGMGEKIWLDSEGVVTREEMALGVQARRPKEKGKEQTNYLALESILARTAVPASEIPADLAEHREARLVLEGTFRAPPSGAWQKVEKEGKRALVGLIRPVIPPPGERNPDVGMMPSDDFALDLDSQRIRELAGQITKDLADDPWEKALAIGNWVNGNLGKSMKECFSALQVLQAGEGECQSHSLLTVALIRAAGIPARFAYGVVYMPADSAFYFHTWVEVHMGEWIPIDPTLGEFPAGVDHLTLAVGGYRDQFSIFPFIMSEGGWRISLAESR